MSQFVGGIKALAVIVVFQGMKLKELKEYWGVSMQALLYRAKSLGRLSDTSYRNAMITVSKNKWRVKEPGAISTLEQPSLFPRALEMVTENGIIP